MKAFERITNKNVLAQIVVMPFFYRLSYSWVLERELTGHWCSFSTLVYLKSQTVSCVDSRELLNDSHRFLLAASEGLCRQTWHLCSTFCGLTNIKTASGVASVVVTEIVVKSPPCNFKSTDVILWETERQSLVSRTKNEVKQPNAEVPILY